MGESVILDGQCTRYLIEDAYFGNVFSIFFFRKRIFFLILKDE